MPPTLRRQAAQHAAIALLVAGLAAAGGIVGVQAFTASRHARAEAAAMLLAEAGAEAAAYRVENMLEWVRTLHELGRRFWLARTQNDVPDAELIAKHLRDVVRRSRLQVLQVAIIDAEGQLAWSTEPDWRPLDLADREHFVVHREGRVEPFVSRPLVGRASGRTSVQVTRPIQQEGAFAGVVVVSLDPEGLTRGVTGPPSYGGALTILFRGDGSVLASTAAEPPRADCAASAGLLAATAAAPQGSGRMCTGFAGQALVAWRGIPDHPLHVAAAVPLAAIRPELPRTRLVLVAPVAAGSAALGAAALLALTLHARRRDRQDAARAEAARRENARLLDALPGAVYRGVLTPDGEYRRLYLSAELCRMTGYPDDALATPQDVRALMEPDVAQDRPGFRLRVLQTGEQTMEYRLQALGGRWIWVRDRCRLVRRLPDGGGEVVGLLTEITTERDLQAKAMVASRLATLGEMAAGIAHELNQPAAAIAMACDVAMLELDAGDAARRAAARTRLEDIAQQIIRMREIVDHLRAFSRPDEAAPGTARVAAMVNGALALAAGTLHAAGVKVEVRLAPDLPPVRGRLTALEQVMVNLLGNARDAMAETPSAARALEIVAWHDTSAAQVAIAVRDRGQGLPPDIAERAFEPFFTTKPVGEGTGLGLSIAYGTIRGFGGTITIANRDGGGAEVLIRLPEATG